MQKTIFITGATDGIGLDTAKQLAKLDHKLLIHGRSATKLQQVKSELSSMAANHDLEVETYQADFSNMDEVEALVNTINAQQTEIDVLINNAGVLKVTNPNTSIGVDVRFTVNTLAPYVLTKGLLTKLSTSARVINIASAAQAEFDLGFLQAKKYQNDMQAYSESKLALITWTKGLAHAFEGSKVQFIAVNPGSLLATNMVKSGFGIDGNDISIGSELLVKIALSDEFLNVSGRYFDNDIQAFGEPNPMASNLTAQQQLIEAMDEFLANR